jgi:hypothetical protein
MFLADEAIWAIHGSLVVTGYRWRSTSKELIEDSLVEQVLPSRVCWVLLGLAAVHGPISTRLVTLFAATIPLFC